MNNNICYHHNLAVRENICKGCTHCMKKCPTNAIRIQNGHAVVDEEKCIECGQCLIACPHHAIKVVQSPFEMLFNYQIRVAIVPTMFLSQFEDEITDEMIYMALKKIGFTHIYLSELGIDIQNLLGIKDINTSGKNPIIANCCPSVSQLIKIKYPLLAPHMSIIKPPNQITAIFARAEMIEKYKDPDSIGLFYITPCPAKISQINTAEKDGLKLFDGVLNLNTVYNLVHNCLTKNKKKFATLIDNVQMEFPIITKNSARWALLQNRGELKGKRSLAIDEIHQVIEFLEEIEENDEININFLELKACAEGCVGGILATRNKFLAAERLNFFTSKLPKQLDLNLINRIMKYKKLLSDNIFIAPDTIQKSLNLDNDIEIAIHKLEKINEIVKVLPGIDCGLCGAPTCFCLAEDISQKKASIRQCAVLRLRDSQGLNTLAKIWGEKISSN